MKRFLILMLALTMLPFAPAAAAEYTASLSFADLTGYEWIFASGVGGWQTQMFIGEDGSFSGSYHDSEMGETGPDYPDGTIYGSFFHGAFSKMEQVSDLVWQVKVQSLELDEGQADEAIEEGIRYVTSAPVGIAAGQTFTLFAPSVVLIGLPENFLVWGGITGVTDGETILTRYALYCEEADSAFFAWEPWDTGMANPWQEITAEELAETAGVRFGVPEGAEDVSWWLMSETGLAEMQFVWANGDFCARIQSLPAFEDISGLYETWTYEEKQTVGAWEGVMRQAQEDGRTVQSLQWYDADAGRMYSVSVTADDLDGFDLTAIAEQIYLPSFS